MRTAAILASRPWAVAATFRDDGVKTSGSTQCTFSDGSRISVTYSRELATEPVGKALNNGVIDVKYTLVRAAKWLKEGRSWETRKRTAK
jgi:hypothetical protein